jgi:transcriptional regulator with XRE-family HTH domain
MDLKIYFYKKNILGRDFAKKIGLSHGALSQILNGHRIPHRSTAEKIEVATNGDVKATDLLIFCLQKRAQKVIQEKKNLQQKTSCRS